MQSVHEGAEMNLLNALLAMDKTVSSFGQKVEKFQLKCRNNQKPRSHWSQLPGSPTAEVVCHRVATVFSVATTVALFSQKCLWVCLLASGLIIESCRARVVDCMTTKFRMHGFCRIIKVIFVLGYSWPRWLQLASRICASYFVNNVVKRELSVLSIWMLQKTQQWGPTQSTEDS